MKKTKIGIIGIGHLGMFHLKNLSQMADRVEIVGICDLKSEEKLNIAKSFHVPFIEDYRAFAQKVDAIDICTPTNLHHEIAKFFLENNIHTFIEKPIAQNVQQADELVALAEKHNLKLQIGHVERFNAAFESIKHLTIYFSPLITFLL